MPMKSHMIAVVSEYHQVLRPVVGLVTVDMVDHLTFGKASPQQFLRDQNMLPHIPIASRPMMVGHIYNGIPSVIDWSIFERKPPVSISVHRTTLSLKTSTIPCTQYNAGGNAMPFPQHLYSALSVCNLLYQVNICFLVYSLTVLPLISA